MVRKMAFGLVVVVVVVVLGLVSFSRVRRVVPPSNEEIAAFFSAHEHPPIGLDIMAAFAEAAYTDPGDPYPDGIYPFWEHGWERHPTNYDDDESGLTYSVFRTYTEDGFGLVVFAFRGTNPRDMRDWRANLRGFVGAEQRSGERDQYKAAAKRILEAVESEYDNFNGPDTFYWAVGHSLGGGLAQLAGFGQNWINTVYVFNSSPVTGWDDYVSPESEYFDGGQVKIVSVRERGEVLEYVSGLAALVDGEQPEGVTIDELIVDYMGGNSIQQHSMVNIARELHQEAIGLSLR